VLTGSQPSDVGQDDVLRPAIAQALPHLLRSVPGVEDLCVHCLLPDIDALAAAAVCMQLFLHSAQGQSRQKRTFLFTSIMFSEEEDDSFLIT